MRYLSLAALAAGYLMTGCKSAKPIVEIPIEEYRTLDTLVVSAPEFDLDDNVFSELEDSYTLAPFNGSHTRTHDLLHTKLEVRFDWAKEQVIGQATLKLKPYFYPSSQVTLDAKGFEFKAVRFAGASEDLDYEYDNKQIVIDLGREFKRTEEYELYLDYVATPRASGGSAAISSDKGLFFINPDGTADKPQQIWTQGETEHNSRWFPTIDKPNERCTQEIYVTVQDKYKTLSNGLLLSSEKNTDGTRTDYWKMDLPHAPYLFMLTVGDFAVVKDDWNGMLLEYYVEAEFKEYARDIFPYTPDMLTFFSDILGVKYPWQKYSQGVVRDFVSGAMENTTAVIFGEFMNGTKDELVDVLLNEKIVAHEMIHHWFGDLVTCESWANLTMNEAFGNYGEYLWLEHKHGIDEAQYHWLQEVRGYLGQAASNIHPLIDYDYKQKEDMFDAHSYNKGGTILNMLRNYLGDDAFFAALNLFLTRHAYTDVESDELRMAFEDVTGKDLLWFFDQWFMQAGHPKLKVQSKYDAEQQKVVLTVTQTQVPTEEVPAIFQLPVAVDIYTGKNQSVRQNIFINQREQQFEFDATSEPSLVLFDADRVLLAEIEREKTDAQYVFQYHNAPTFLGRYEALQALAEQDSPLGKEVYEAALSDEFYGLRALAISLIDPSVPENAERIKQLAKNDPHSSVRSSAIEQLLYDGNPKYQSLFEEILEKDKAKSVQASARQGIAAVYANGDDLSKLAFFEENWSSIDGFDVIGFLDSYQKLAAKGSVEQILETAKKLENIALENTSLWRRFGAMKSLNELHATLNAQAKDAETDAQTFMDADATVVAMIEKVKQKETDGQLTQLYKGFPAP
ncbi:MAG: DUF3458 domain-containing protein [Bacteroidota bacterium]